VIATCKRRSSCAAAGLPDCFNGCTLRVYRQAAHGLFLTHADLLNADLRAFAEGPQSRAVAGVTS
jgi:hypothetical protein